MKTWNGFEKGINLGGWLSQWDLTDREHLETFITEQDIQDIRAMGADHVRLPVDYSPARILPRIGTRFKSASDMGRKLLRSVS